MVLDDVVVELVTGGDDEVVVVDELVVDGAVVVVDISNSGKVVVGIATVLGQYLDG